ncbi:MAG: hypothetical protein LUQ12_00995 [Methanoregulaceae archaeon]|nr:hypothetical protein [Methanoregulaceae archaeon]
MTTLKSGLIIVILSVFLAMGVGIGSANGQEPYVAFDYEPIRPGVGEVITFDGSESYLVII